MARARGKIVHKFKVAGLDGVFAELEVRMRKADRSSEVTTFHVTEPKLNLDVGHESIDEVVKLAKKAAMASPETKWDPVQIAISLDANLKENHEGAAYGPDQFGVEFKYYLVQIGTPPAGELVMRYVVDLQGADPSGVHPASRLPDPGKSMEGLDNPYGYENPEVCALIEGTEENLAKSIELCGRLRALYDRLATIIDQDVDLFGGLGLTGFMELKPINRTWIEKILAKRDSQ